MVAEMMTAIKKENHATGMIDGNDKQRNKRSFL